MHPYVLDSLKTWLHSVSKARVRATQGRQLAIMRDDGPPLNLPPIPANIKGAGKETAKRFAIYLLKAGAEVEHSLLVQYLYAAYSINERKGDLEKNCGLNWKTHIRLVAREEMAHLVTVQNLLLSLGADVYLDRASMNRRDAALPLPFVLERLTLDSLAKYIVFESPSPRQLDGKYDALMEEVHGRLGDNPRFRIQRVGIIYAAIYWLFMESDDPGPDWPFAENQASEFIQQYGAGLHLSKQDFISGEEYQDRAAGADEWEVFESDAHVDDASPRETALAGLRWIMAQGEGPNALEESHFSRFVQIYEELKQLDGKYDSISMRVPTKPYVKCYGFVPPAAPPRPKNGQRHGTPITHPRTRLWAELVNARYQLLILHIFASLSASRSREGQKRRKFAALAIGEMELVKKIGQLLPHMSLARSGDRKAGAVFDEVCIASNETERGKFCRQLLSWSDQCVSELEGMGTAKPKKLQRRKLPENTSDAPTQAQGPELLEAVSRQTDLIRETLSLE
jgi:hypothetical protein